ncbi:hypothetical protein H5410_048664 [Solanum commersonii]|uniref:Uncharacterized protein n=1 Tax=Solanum commersonii TaxID=4109 RepID=A0A9J5XME0_SOLCO|nr:hypothetical protein H5410_048664 [Solanum commersonii]
MLVARVVLTPTTYVDAETCLGVDMEVSDMSFSVSLDQGRGCEWGTRNGFASLFVQKKNVLNPYFWQMIREISRFKQDVISLFRHEHVSHCIEVTLKNWTTILTLIARKH